MYGGLGMEIRMKDFLLPYCPLWVQINGDGDQSQENPARLMPQITDFHRVCVFVCVTMSASPLCNRMDVALSAVNNNNVQNTKYSEQSVYPWILYWSFIGFCVKSEKFKILKRRDIIEIVLQEIVFQYQVEVSNILYMQST